MKRLVLAIALSAGVALPLPAFAAAALAQHHMIAAAEPAAAEAGLAMLRAGGSAVDAAIAAQLVLTLVEPQASGIGGGAYMVVADGQAVRGYDGRETAPASAGPNLFLDRSGMPRGFRDVQYGGLPVGVPGDLAMMALAHKDHGRLPWARLFEPAIALAEGGFTVPPRLALELAESPRLSMLPDTRSYFFHADGTPVRAGERLKNPALAKSLRQIAQMGPDVFYKGAIAGEIATAVTKAPLNAVAFTAADLAGYVPKTYPALCDIYRMYRVCGMPPSTSGGVTVLQILGLLQHFPSQALKPQTLSAVHLISEAEKLAYADRLRWLGDPDFVADPVDGLLNGDYLTMRARLIDPARSMGMASAGMPPLKRGTFLYAPQQPQPEYGTSHLAVVDDRGEVVSMTMSVQAAFGAAIMAGGFILNNELTDFAFQPVVDGRPVANAAAPGKRPLSSMAPFILFGPDGKFFAAVGSPGGRQIIAFVAQAIIGLIDGQMSMQEAAAQPRHIDMNGPIVLERGTALEAMAPQLMAMGQQIRTGAIGSGVNGIRRVAGGYEGGVDPRREGVALGD